MGPEVQHQEPQKSLVVGDSGAAWKGVVERASRCWNCTGKKMEETQLS